MAYQGTVENITLTKENNPKAIEVVNTLAAAWNRSAANTAELLIIEAGEQRSEKIKQEKGG